MLNPLLIIFVMIEYNRNDNTRRASNAITRKMKNTKFSPSEEIVIDFILTKQERIKDYSTTMIAGETYTSPSLLVRISKN